MYALYRKALFQIFLVGVLLSLFAAAVAFPASASFRDAPDAPAHNINFQAVGLPDGVSFTITGTRYNNGGHLGTYSISFTTPDLNASIGVNDNSEVTYSGFPASLTVGTQYFVLASLLPTSPFYAGAPGGLTTVVATYQAVCVLPSITVDPGDLTVQYGDPVTFTIAASGSPTLTYEWYKDGGLIQGAAQSTYMIPFAHRSDDGSYYAVVTNSCGTDTSASAQLTVNKAEQLITFTPLASPAVYGTSFNLHGSASSGLEVAFAVFGVCGLAGNTVTMVGGTGDCTITASQAGDDNYNPAPDEEQIVAAAKAAQTITFDPLASQAIYGTSFVLQATASSGLEVTFGVSGVCSLVGNTVTMTGGTGSCAVTAAQGGDGNYNPAPDAVQTVAAVKADQTIGFTSLTNPATYGTSFTLTASASSGLEVAFAVSGVCSLAGNTVTMTGGTGGCSITASQGGDDNYNQAPTVMQNVDAARAEQNITLAQPPSPVKYQTSFTVSPTSSAGLPVALTSSGSCINVGFIVTMVKTSGACLLTASQAGDLNYLPAQHVQHSVDPSPNGNVIYMPVIIRK